jgi:hypothetical protein
MMNERGAAHLSGPQRRFLSENNLGEELKQAGNGALLGSLPVKDQLRVILDDVSTAHKYIRNILDMLPGALYGQVLSRDFLAYSCSIVCRA